MTIKSVKQCSSAEKKIRDASELAQWMIDMFSCNIGCSRQSFMIYEARTSEWRKRQPA